MSNGEKANIKKRQRNGYNKCFNLKKCLNWMQK